MRPERETPPANEASPSAIEAHSAPPDSNVPAPPNKKHFISTDRLEKFGKSMDKLYWAFEAGALALSAVEEVGNLRNLGRIERNLPKDIGLVAQKTAQRLARSKAHTAVLAAYFLSKLIAKRGKNLAKMFPSLRDNAYVNAGADAINLVASPVNAIQTALKTVQDKRSGGLGPGIEVVEVPQAEGGGGTEMVERLPAKKHRISTETLKKIGKPFDQLGWAFELTGLSAAIGSFLGSARLNGIQLRGLREQAAGGVLTEAGLKSMQKIQRSQTLLLFTSIYFTLRVIGSRRKNIENLFPKVKESPTFNGIMDGLSLIVSPWRVAMGVMTRPDRPKTVFEQVEDPEIPKLTAQQAEAKADEAEASKQLREPLPSR